MVELRESRHRRLFRWIALPLGLVAALLVVRAYQWIRDRQIIDACAVAYGRARTGADTAAVDLNRPVMDRLTAVGGMSCGALRRAGRINKATG